MGHHAQVRGSPTQALIGALRARGPLSAGVTAYAGALALGSAVLAAQDEPSRERWLSWASTNVANLQSRPLAAVVASAFLAEESAPVWVLLALVGLLAAGWRLGGWRLLAVVASAHVVGTLVSEGVVAWRVHLGLLPETARHAVDVGPSFVVVSALAAALVAGPWASRLVGAAGLALLAPYIFEGLGHLDVAAVGHVVSITVGAGLGFVAARRGAGSLRGRGAAEPSTR